MRFHNAPILHETNNNGSALIVTAIIVLLGGLIGLSLLYNQAAPRELQEEQTLIKMRRIVHVLSVYYQRYSRIPCPADPDTAAFNPPFGAERGSGVDGADVGDCPLVDQEDGIVPYRTLGLNENDITDAWGRYLTYHVNQSSTWSAEEAAAYIAAFPNINVIDLCRMKDIWVDTSGLRDNYYPQQALACCMKPEAGIRIINGNGADLAALPSITSDRFAPQRIPALPSSLHPPYTIPNPPAIVLISHGRIGNGAYLGTGTHERAPVGGSSAAKIANASGDKGNTVFIDMPRTESLVAYFDDIVMFKTLPALYGEAGGSSGGACSFAPGCPPVPQNSARATLMTFNDLNGNPCP